MTADGRIGRQYGVLVVLGRRRGRPDGPAGDDALRGSSVPERPAA